MAITLKQMLDAGVHLGHETSKWNPRMRPFIYTQKNNLHILDLIKSYKYTLNSLKFAQIAASQGQTIMFIGTKKQAKRFIAEAALECNSFYVNEKWVGGLFTNWETFSKSTSKLLLLEQQESNGFLEKLPKKEMSKKLKEKEKLTKLFDGIKHMKALPDLVVIVGQLEEMNAVKECNRLGIRTITLMDTDCDPAIADLIIPSNDDSMATIKLILDEFALLIQQGQQMFDSQQNTKNKNITNAKNAKNARNKPNKKANNTLVVQRNKSSIQWKKDKQQLKLAQEAFVAAQEAVPVPVLQSKPERPKVLAT